MIAVPLPLQPKKNSKGKQLSLLKFTTAIGEGLISGNKVQPEETPERPGRTPKRKSTDAETPLKCGKKPTAVPMPDATCRFDQIGHIGHSINQTEVAAATARVVITK